MKTKAKPTITYIKNNKEITKKVTIFNIDKVLKEISTSNNINSLTLDAEYIHIKNMSFSEPYNIKFFLQDHQILILEDCTFNGSALKFYNGNVQMINPKFKKYNSRITAQNLNDLSIILDSSTNPEYELDITAESNNFYLDGNHQPILKEISVTGETATLCNIREVTRLKLDIYEEINLEKNNEIIVTDFDECRLETQRLKLGNTILKAIDSNWETTIYIHCKELIGENFQLQSDTIMINETTYQRKGTQEKLNLTSKDLKQNSQRNNRTKIISILKGIRGELHVRYLKEGTKVMNQLLQKMEHQVIGDELNPKRKERVNR